MAHSHSSTPAVADGGAERQEFLTYVTGFIGALILTFIPFALVNWHTLPQHALIIVIGALALIQAVVHFRFFLHVGTKHNGDEFKVLLFTILMLVVMVGGTLWVMTDLAMRMMPH